jgi:hypothetical protein
LLDHKKTLRNLGVGGTEVNMRIVASMIGLIAIGAFVWSIAGPATGNLPPYQAPELMMWSLAGLGVALVLDALGRFLRAAEKKAERK